LSKIRQGEDKRDGERASGVDKGVANNSFANARAAKGKQSKSAHKREEKLDANDDDH